MLLFTQLATATTFIPEPPDTQVGKASVVFVGTVVRTDYDIDDTDGEIYPITHHHLQITTVLLGDVQSGEVKLLLPGGAIGDRFIHSVGTPQLGAGDTVLVVGTRHTHSVVALTNWSRSIFFKSSSGVALASDRAPVGDFNCTEGSLLVRPLTKAPSAVYDGLTMSSDEAITPLAGPIYAENPIQHGIDWETFVDKWQGCVGSSQNTGEVLTGSVP